MRVETTVGLFVLAAIGIFFYMSFHIGVFRLDRAHYAPYTIYFADISGLYNKADVKISGVKVGWVDSVSLSGDSRQVRADLMVRREQVLHTDAYGVVRQDGLLGTKFLELTPGDSLLPRLQPGSVIAQPANPPPSIDQIMQQVRDIAAHIGDITAAVKEAVGGGEMTGNLRGLIENVRNASEQIAQAASAVNSVVSGNQQAISGLINDLRDTTSHARNQLPEIAAEIRALSRQLGQDVLPALQKTLERVGTILDNDVAKVSQTISAVAEPMAAVAQKIKNGEGVIGKLMCDDSALDGVSDAVASVSRAMDKVKQVKFGFNLYSYWYQAYVPSTCQHNILGQLDFFIQPTDTLWVIAGFGASRAGRLKRFDVRNCYYADVCATTPMDEQDMQLSDANQLKYAPRKVMIERELNRWVFNLQLGKLVLPYVAVRLGVFESTFGAGLDVTIPMLPKPFDLMTAVEMYDFRASKRLAPDRPHLRWFWRLFFKDHLYLVGGLDDIMNQPNGFIGIGLTYGKAHSPVLPQGYGLCK
jgi:phospholipid/cholesterol/gamma-HCH transport system substrate-binding protein